MDSADFRKAKRLAAVGSPRSLVASLLLLLAPAAAAAENDWGGYVAFEGRGFANDPLHPGQGDDPLSFVLEPEYYREWDDGDQSFRFTPFLRWDSADDERTHADVRELYWGRAALGWELSLGVRKVFWGVTESQHLVDVVNQTDLVEDPDGEAKLGQPLARLDLIRSWGTWELYVLPGFRERTFPGSKGRLRGGLPVDGDRATFESAAGRGHVDYAVRWSHYLGDWDLGLSHFSGTGREPRLLPGARPSGEIVLTPRYEQIDQTGLDLQATKGSWLWKLEAISRRDARERFLATTGGFEYTFSDLRGSGIDVGVLLEYLYDGRDTARVAFEDDVFVGTRIALNDVQSTDLLLGVIVDRVSGARFLNLEASRRLGERWKLEVRARGFAGVPNDDVLFAVRGDDYLQVQLARYF